MAKFNCQHCEKTFDNVSNLNRHVNTVHNKQVWKCDKCLFEFARKDNLQAHQKRTGGQCGGGTNNKRKLITEGQQQVNNVNKKVCLKCSFDYFR